VDELEELLRVNAELAAEIRALSGERTEKPRSGKVPAARGIARLQGERDSLAARLEQAEAELAATRADRDGLERQNREMAAEIARLSAGFSGFLRRARGRLLSR
jgi:chromosome segregation ATPase